MEWWMLWLIIAIVAGLLVIGFLFLKKKMKEKMAVQQELIEQMKMTQTIFVIAKRIDNIKNSDIPKKVLDQIPKMYKIKKIPLVKAKIGPMVIDLICEENIFSKIPEKKNVKVEIAGIFISNVLDVVNKGKSKNKSKGKR
jgi:hypothetical protein